MELYKQHRNTSSFERISLYFGWLNYGPRMVWYLLKCMLCQFGYLQKIPSHPHDFASSTTTQSQVSHQYVQYLNHMLRLQDLGLHVVNRIETEVGYMWCYLTISHTYILSQLEALDEVVVEEQGDYRWLNMNMRFGRIKNHVLSIIGSGVVV